MEFDVCMAATGCHWEKTQCALMHHLSKKTGEQVEMKDAGDAADLAIDGAEHYTTLQVRVQEEARAVQKAQTPRASYVQVPEGAVGDDRTKSSDNIIGVILILVVGCTLWFVLNKKQTEARRFAEKQT